MIMNIESIIKEVESIEVDATNFIEERDRFEDEHPRTNFLDYLSDAQLVRIARTSNDYEFDEINGIITEVLNRTETEVPDELEEGQYQDIYEEALDKLEETS